MASIEVSEERGVRYLHFGSAYVQGAMRIARPWALELEYTRQMMLPLLLRAARWPASVLQVGLGSASFTRFFHKHRPDARLIVVEISPPVVAVARQHFHLPPESAHLHIEIVDGYDYLATTRRRFDLILVDAFDARGRAGMLDSAPFYANLRARLAPSGIASINLLTRTRGAAPAIARVRDAFEGHAQALPITEAGNLVILAGDDIPIVESMADLRAAAKRLKAETGLDLTPTLNRGHSA